MDSPKCLLKPFSISELMEISDKCAIKGKQNEQPDFTSLLSYGNEAVMTGEIDNGNRKGNAVAQVCGTTERPSETGRPNTPPAQLLGDTPCRQTVEGTL